jgi:predicted Zn-dependent protease
LHGQERPAAGLFKVARSADDLAGILGHEMAHVIARHGSENMTRRILPLVGAMILEGLTGYAAGGNLLLAMVELSVNLPNSRKAEVEADRIGIEIAALACYDPQGLSRSLQARPSALLLQNCLNKLSAGTPFLPLAVTVSMTLHQRDLC